MDAGMQHRISSDVNYTRKQKDLKMKKHLFVAYVMAVMALAACSKADDDTVGGPASDASAASAPAAVSDAALDTSAAASGASTDANDSASAAPASGASE
jgi:hypothetical protein